MYIIVGEEAAAQVDNKYLIFELDTILYNKNEDPVKSYCVVDNEHVPLTDLSRIEEFQKLHAKLIENYHKRNWEFCLDAISHLRGKFRGELDSFYDDIEKRCQVFKQFEPPQDWNGVYDKTK